MTDVSPPDRPDQPERPGGGPPPASAGPPSTGAGPPPASAGPASTGAGPPSASARPPSTGGGPPSTGGGPPSTGGGPPSTGGGPPSTGAGPPSASAGPPSAGGPLDSSERFELERLRAQAAARSHRGTHAWRWVASVVLMVLTALIGLAGVTAIWLRAEVLNTSRYVDTVAPLASDPAIQQAVSARLSDEIVAKLDVQGLATQLVQALEQRGVPPQLSSRLNDLVPTIVSGIESFLNDKIHEVVSGPRFAEFWANANRTAHQQVDAILTGKNSNLISTNNTAIVIDLGQVLEMVKQRLVEAGFSAAQRIPQTSIPYTVAQINDLPKIQRTTELLNTLGWVLPVLALLLGIAAVATAPNHRRGLLITVTIFGVTMLLGLAAIALARERVLSNLPATVKSPAAAAALWDTLIRFLISGLKTVVVLCAIVILLTLVAGPSRLAHAIRHGLNRLLDWLGGLIGSVGLHFGPVPQALARNRVAIRVGLVVLAFMSLVIWRTPGIAGTLGVTAIALGVLTIIEIIARIPPRAVPATGH